MNSGAEDKPRRELGRGSRPKKKRPRYVREAKQAEPSSGKISRNPGAATA